MKKYNVNVADATKTDDSYKATDEMSVDASDYLYDADPACKHDVEILWSGIKCKKCRGWCCLLRRLH